MVETDRGYRNIKCRNLEDFLLQNEKQAKKKVPARHKVVYFYYFDLYLYYKNGALFANAAFISDDYK